MKKIYLLIYLLLYTLNPGLVLSAPVSGIGSFSFDKNANNKFLSGFKFLIRADHQNNQLPTQSKQVLYKDPGTEEDARHYTKSRSSHNSSDITEFEFGSSFFNNVYIYGKAGFGRFQSELLILDEIVVGLYQSPSRYEITDNFMFTYGGGLSVKIFEKELKSAFKYLSTQIDFQYRRFSIDSGSSGILKKSYNADLDEIQGAVLLNGTSENISVFLVQGFQVLQEMKNLKLKKEILYMMESSKHQKI